MLTTGRPGVMCVLTTGRPGVMCVLTTGQPGVMCVLTTGRLGVMLPPKVIEKLLSEAFLLSLTQRERGEAHAGIVASAREGHSMSVHTSLVKAHHQAVFELKRAGNYNLLDIGEQ